MPQGKIFLKGDVCCLGGRSYVELQLHRSVPGHRCAITRFRTALGVSLTCCSCGLVPKHAHKLTDGELYLMVLGHGYWSSGWKESRPQSEEVASEHGNMGNILKGIEQWCFLPLIQLLTKVFIASLTCYFKQHSALLMLACQEKLLVIMCIECLS